MGKKQKYLQIFHFYRKTTDSFPVCYCIHWKSILLSKKGNKPQLTKEKNPYIESAQTKWMT